MKPSAENSCGDSELRDSDVRLSSPRKSDETYLLDILTEREQMLLEEIKNSSQKQINPTHKLEASKFSEQEGSSPNRLYKQALEKKENQKMMEAMAKQKALKESKMPKLSKGSYKIMMRKSEESLERALAEVDIHDSRLLTFEKVGRILTILQIFKVLCYNQYFQLVQSEICCNESVLKRRVQEMNLHQSLWSVVTGSMDVGEADIEVIFITLRILTEPINMSIPQKSEQIVKSLVGYWQSICAEEDCFERIRAESIINLVRLYKQLQRDRLAFEKIGYFKANKFTEIVSEEKSKFTFRPKLASETSDRPITELNEEDYDETKNLSSPRYLQLLDKQRAKQEKLEAKRKQKQQKELMSCTFQPNIKKAKGRTSIAKEVPLIDRLYQFTSKEQKELKEQQAKEDKQLNELQLCTFQPNAKKSSVKSTSRVSLCAEQVPGFDKAVGRLRYANNLNKLKKHQLQHIPTGENYRGPGSYKVEGPSFLNREKVKKEAMVYIDVNMVGGKIGRIAFHKGDDLRSLARSFCQIYGLGESIEQDIFDLLVEQLQDNE